MGKVENVDGQHFLLCPQYFLKPHLFRVTKWQDCFFNSLPNNNVLDMTKLKACANDKIAKMIISLFDIEENAVLKGENAGYHHFLVFPCFLSLGSFKIGILW